MLTEFILISGWFFWACIFAVIVLDICLLSSDGEGQAVFITATAALAIVLFTDAFAGVRVVTLLTGLAIYLAIGAVWLIKKWYGFVVGSKADLRKNYDDYVHKDMKGNETFASYIDGKMPTAARNKQRITSWMALWPFSVTWWVLTWPRRAFVWLYERLSTLFDRISAHVWAKV